MVVGALGRNAEAALQGEAEGEGSLEVEAVTAAVVLIAALRDLNAVAVSLAEREAGITDLHALESVVGGSESIDAGTALMVLHDFVGRLVLVTVVDHGQAGTLIIGDEIALLTLNADVFDVVDVHAVRDDCYAGQFVSGDIEVISALAALHGLGPEVRFDVAETVLNFRETLASVSAESVSVVAGLAAVLVVKVDSAIVDLCQAHVAASRQAGEEFVTLNAKTLTVVEHTVGDGSQHALGPVERLSVAVVAVGTEVGSWDVLVAVGHRLQAPVVDQDGRTGTLHADGGWSVGSVVHAADDHGNWDTGLGVP